MRYFNYFCCVSIFFLSLFGAIAVISKCGGLVVLSHAGLVWERFFFFCCC